MGTGSSILEECSAWLDRTSFKDIFSRECTPPRRKKQGNDRILLPLPTSDELDIIFDLYKDKDRFPTNILQSLSNVKDVFLLYDRRYWDEKAEVCLNLIRKELEKKGYIVSVVDECPLIDYFSRRSSCCESQNDKCWIAIDEIVIAAFLAKTQLVYVFEFETTDTQINEMKLLNQAFIRRILTTAGTPKHIF